MGVLTLLLGPTLGAATPQAAGVVRLPSPDDSGAMPVAEALTQRRSVREFARQPLALRELATLLWAAQGRRGPQGHRTAPSAGALYPMRIYVAAGAVSGLAPGVYAYEPGTEARLVLVRTGDRRAALSRSALGQPSVAGAPAVIVLAADVRVTATKYGGRARRYVLIESGAVAENVYLQATALGLGTVLVGAFADEAVAEVLALPSHVEPLGLMPVGRPRHRNE
jgi:SagB-type dehydrogenase family enzyme